MTAMWLGIHAPERVEKLALLCTSPRMGPPEMWPDRAARCASRARRRSSTRRCSAGSPTPTTTSTPINWLRESFIAIDDEGYANCCRVIEHMDLVPNLDGISAPTLVIGGAKDPATPPDEHARKIAEGIPGARLEILDGAHLINVEQPGRGRRLLLEHLR